MLRQDFQKGLAVDWVMAECRIHQVTRVVERALGSGGQAFEPDMGLVDQKGFQNGVWLAAA